MEYLSLTLQSSSPTPLGAYWQEGAFHFALHIADAEEVALCLYAYNDNEAPSKIQEIPLDPHFHKTGNTWHLAVHPLPDTVLYYYKIRFKNQQISQIVFDPYAQHLFTGHQWGTCHAPQDSGAFYFPFGAALKSIPFDWENDLPPARPLDSLVIYEMHVRSFTQHPSSQVQYPGTFLGIIEKIPHLVELGINAVELMPVHEYNELEYARSFVPTRQPLYNYWGYSPVNFFAPMNRFASSSKPGSANREFKEMVKALHKQGIEVILDVVFNHTSEEGPQGPAYSYRLLDDSAYYLHDTHGHYLDFTGCGNTFNTNHPVSLELILDCLRYWVSEMHVDGFRFDLASVFCRDLNGNVVIRSAILEAISRDSILANCKLIAEPWDAVGFYQVGAFAPFTPKWAEWNGRYRDTLRRFMKGIPGLKGDLATRFCGSEDLYKISNRTPANSIQFVTAHDGFTLADLVSYNSKHNLENGENNRDGLNENDSWNCGFEGPTDNPSIVSLRERQKRNFVLMLLLSQGVPMLHMGDEYGHTKYGNNNTWCQDNALNWFSWNQLTHASEFFNFFKKAVHFRLSHPFFKNAHFLTPQDIIWHGLLPNQPSWNEEPPFIAMTLHNREKPQQDLYLALNADSAIASLTLPSPSEGTHWSIVANTAAVAPSDFVEDPTLPILTKTFTMAPHSALLLKEVTK